MKVVRAIGQAFEVCHKEPTSTLSYNNTSAQEHQTNDHNNQNQTITTTASMMNGTTVQISGIHQNTPETPKTTTTADDVTTNQSSTNPSTPTISQLHTIVNHNSNNADVISSSSSTQNQQNSQIEQNHQQQMVDLTFLTSTLKIIEERIDVLSNKIDKMEEKQEKLLELLHDTSITSNSKIVNNTKKYQRGHSPNSLGTPQAQPSYTDSKSSTTLTPSFTFPLDCSSRNPSILNPSQSFTVPPPPSSTSTNGSFPPLLSLWNSSTTGNPFQVSNNPFRQPELQSPGGDSLFSSGRIIFSCVNFWCLYWLGSPFLKGKLLCVL